MNIPALPHARSSVPKLIRSNSTAPQAQTHAAGPRPGVVRAKEPAHLPLHRRLLFPTYPPDKPLPPIIRAGGLGQALGKQVELDLRGLNDRLYHLIALVLRAYVLSWYPRFSRDRTLSPILTTRVVVPLLSPILSDLHTDTDRLVELVLIGIPSALRLHLATYWQARQAIAINPHLFTATDAVTTVPLSGPRDIDHLVLGSAYHARLSLLSVTRSAGSTESEQDAEPYRQPIPPGQYVLSPFYLAALADALLRLHLPADEYGSPVERSMAREIVGRAVLGAVGRKLGDGWFWWTLGLKLLGPPRTAASQADSDGRAYQRDQGVVERCTTLLLRVWTAAVAIWTVSVSLFARYSAAPPLDARYSGCSQVWLALGREMLGVDGRYGAGPRRWSLRLIWGFVEAVVGLLASFIDRLLPHMIKAFLDLSLAFRLCDLVERLLFPLDGYPAPSPPDLTPDEARKARKHFEDRLAEVIPEAVRRLVIPTPADIALLLDPLDDSGCNAHMVGLLLDSMVGALEPGLVASDPAGGKLPDYGWDATHDREGMQAPDQDNTG